MSDKVAAGAAFLDERSRNDLIETARSFFRENVYTRAEPILHQLAISGQGTATEQAEVWHMIAVILYDRGRFTKAIKTFRRALEIDPTFTDASVGLSIILNDLGRYEEGRQVFQNAQGALDRKNFDQDTHLKERLASKHHELADMYFSRKRWDDAIDQYKQALAILPAKTDFRLKIVEALAAKGELGQAFKEIRQIVQEQPANHAARLKFGFMLYQSKRVADAIDQWETILLRDPGHPQAKEYMRMARESDETLTEL
jgi:tetratricopeptide (TPR) repeat protein